MTSEGTLVNGVPSILLLKRLITQTFAKARLSDKILREFKMFIIFKDNKENVSISIKSLTGIQRN